MAHTKPKYDISCYYSKKFMGRCTRADGEAYTAMMDKCGGDAARVLREYAYFSPEMKTILENVAAIQVGRGSIGLLAQPKNSPWGEIQHCDPLCTGVFMVDTASHGGTMVSKDMEAVLSPAARKYGIRQNGYLCFEEDTAENIVFRELLDKKLWTIPDRIKDKAAYEENINKSLREYHPDYWKARQRGLDMAQSRHTPVPARHAEL